MRIVLLIMASVLCGCGHVERGRPVDRGITLATEIQVQPVVCFHIMYQYSWESFYVTESEDLDLTLPEALKMGIPAEVWIYCAICWPAGYRVPIYFVKPVRI